MKGASKTKTHYYCGIQILQKSTAKIGDQFIVVLGKEKKPYTSLSDAHDAIYQHMFGYLKQEKGRQES